MEEKGYGISFETDASLREFYSSIEKNLVFEHTKMHEFGNIHFYGYLINDCFVYVENDEETSYKEAGLKIFHENSLEKIVDTENILGKLSEISLKEIND